MEEILHQAEHLEKEYDWLRATELHKKALNLLPQDDFSKAGEIHESLGYAFYRFAFQAESKDEFKERLRQSADAYGEAVEFYGKLNEPVKKARISRCNAMIAYTGYWLAPETQEKKKKIDECWRLTKDALAAFKEAGERWEYGKTQNQLSSSVVFAFCLDWNFQAREKMMREAVESGEQAIEFLSTDKNSEDLARAYARTAFYLGVFDYCFLDIDEKERDYQRAQDYWMKSKEISEEIALYEFLYPIFGGQILMWGEASDEAFICLKKALEYGRKTKDRLMMGCAFDWLAYHTSWSRFKIEDTEKRVLLWKTILEHAEDTKHQFSPISFVSPRGDSTWVETAQAESNGPKAYVETDLKKKRELLEEAIELSQNGVKKAEVSGYPETIGYAHHVLSVSFQNRAVFLETKSEEKKRLLEEALGHRIEAIKVVEQLQPYEYWNRGVQQSILASIKFELADLIMNSDAKKKMLEETIADMEKGFQLGLRELRLLLKKDGFVYYGPIGQAQSRMGICLNRLYSLTRNPEHLRRAASVFIGAAGSFQKLDWKSRTAENYWRAAQAYSNLFDHSKAAENFTVASINYKQAAEKIHQLKDFYEEHASYMQAWSEIERARQYHARQDYGSAEQHFEKAANLHKPLKKWSYLAPNYFAWAQVEDAEDLSRKERIEEAINAFKQADNLFS